LAEKSEDQQIRGCLIGDDWQTKLLRASSNNARRPNPMPLKKKSRVLANPALC